ncbi:hypothetical protein FJT64_000062 [Amphibalanus amphitrite]|uniref:Uncharacterized protein n=1 Tax=Amphibalanus amphitrite TaxID=1232801 RepID=A0A6A4VU40_AMPAM|nr:hypothetical protein FJT64_027706 [Amphibalanus amphitrite]KAF0314702.1 hypothetical protein FJT64_000062 [Amphibalanus amphitrite]
MLRPDASRAVGAESEARDNSTSTDQPTGAGERQSVSQLVRAYGDAPVDGQKRDRSESGDQAPAGKRGARERSGEPTRSPSSLSSKGGRSFRDELDAAVEDLEQRVTTSLSRDLHEFRERMSAQIEKLLGRVQDLEHHVEERDNIIDRLSDDLRQSRQEISALQARVEDAEINSRLPCLVLSGPAMAPRRAARLEPPLPGQPPAAVPAGQPGPDPGRAVESRSADRRAGEEGGAGQCAAGAGGERRDTRDQSSARGDTWGDREDVNALVVSTLNQCMPGLSMNLKDIDRAHRLPGPNNRVIVRFVQSGQGSVRDVVMSRRLELRGRDLFINESLTKLRSSIFQSLLAAKREKKIFTVYTRGGQVFFKEKQHGVGTRVNSLQQLRGLGYTPLQR